MRREGGGWWLCTVCALVPSISALGYGAKIPATRGRGGKKYVLRRERLWGRRRPSCTPRVGENSRGGERGLLRERERESSTYDHSLSCGGRGGGGGKSSKTNSDREGVEPRRPSARSAEAERQEAGRRDLGGGRDDDRGHLTQDALCTKFWYGANVF